MDTTSTREDYSIHDLAEMFDRSIARMGLTDYKVNANGHVMSSASITHHANILPGLAMLADQSAINLLGGRIFEGFIYTVKKKQILGVGISKISNEDSHNPDDENIKRTLAIKSLNDNEITMGIRGLLMDMSVMDQFDIDHENKTMTLKQLNLSVHKMFKQTPEYQDGQCIPLLNKDLGVLNEMHMMLYSDIATKALNKARERAAEILIEATRRSKFDMEQDI